MSKLFAWVLRLFKKPQPTLEDKLTAWPFPIGQATEDFEPRPKRKPAVKKATTRPVKKTVAKKPVKKVK